MALAEYGDSSKEAIGRRLKAMRRSLGDPPPSAETVADRLGMGLKVYQHREIGRSTLTFDEAWAVFHAYGIDPRFLIWGDPTPLGSEWPKMRAALLDLDQRRTR